MIRTMARWWAWIGWLLAGASGCLGNRPLHDQQEAVVVVQAQPTAQPLVPGSAGVLEPAPPSPPALSLGGLRPGMTLEQLHRVIGPEGHSEGFDSVRSTWQAAGYDPDRQIEFLVGFDTVLTYNAGLAPIVLPIWSVFVKNGVVAMLKLTMYVPGTGPVEEVGFPPSCFLRSDPRGVEETFGTGYVYEDDRAHGQSTYHFVERGISVLVKDDVIAVMNVYEPLHGARATSVKQALRGSAQDVVP